MITRQPISSVQNKLFSHAKWYSEDSSYNLAFLFQFPVELDGECLCLAIEQVLNAQEVFKVNFEEREKEVVMVHDSDREFKVQKIDIRDILPAEQYGFVKTFADDKFSEVMDITKWPLSPVYLFTGTNNHFVFICIHHIIADVFTAYQFFEKTSAMYNYLKKKSDKMPVLESASYFEAINQMAEDKAQTAAEKYFEQVASECRQADSHFPVERTAAGILKGDTLSFVIKDARIEKYAKADNISVYCFFVLIYSIFMMKINRTDKAKIGIPLANRSKAYKDAFGYFVNVLPLTLSFDTVKAAQKEITQKIFRLLRCQFYDTFLSPNSELLITDNVITFYKEALAFSLSDVTCTPIPLKTQHLKYPLSMTIENFEADSYRITIEYSDYFSNIPLEDTITNLINQVLNGKQSLESIQLLSDREQKSIWSTLNHKEAVSRILGNNVAEVLKKSLNKFSDHIALEDSNTSWTYNKLDEYSDRVAVFLSNHSEQNIVVSIPKSKELIGLMVGVIKAGKTYVPVDITIPAVRKNTILSQLENTMILTDKNNLCQYKGFGHEVIDYAEIELFEGKNQIENVRSDTAYIIFTSGSTGIPKGVMVSHRNVLQYFEAIDNEYNFSEKDTWTLFHSTGFDYSIMEIFGALLFGGKLLIIPHNVCLVPHDFYEFIIDHKATILTQTPTYFVNLLEEDLKTNNNFGCVKYIFSGGEAAHFSLFTPFFDKYENSDYPQLCNVYGVTEATIISTFHTITRNDLLNEENNIIGKPYNNIDCYVGDFNHDLMPAGIPGELIIAGESVTNGYYNNQKDTERVFQKVTNNNLNLLETPIYHTGDLAVLLTSGELKYLDRIDNQVQIRGFRVELGEIETAVMEFDNVKDCIAVYRKFSDNDMRLILYIIKKHSDIMLSREMILDYLKKKLPYYMIPSFIVEIENKPLTVNGKVDKENLPMPSGQIAECKEDKDIYDYVTSTVLTIWKEVLDNPNIAVNDNFFDVGGTSIHLPKIYYKILDALNIDEKQLNMIDIFEFTTIELLSEHIRTIKKEILV